ncbi:hypothetical protein MPTK1_3g04760 [Marchantia polymorpha subsp. ruderalis]|uniref:Uncharacterized protein n=2 Tax=Marchantia polymorpha TaxID=3197 RepID=A0AAF6AXG9_MARPO|nr:hypothetical protein MARPO_0022s0053 [Marchantia polymorpha]BBN04453.1 hypothetical protein Mp_3g04760 [Marchantia polymorpha subsp. ruderalis]|eukprot:PTQ43949.1 hypothetical protein MARPO_0022s0053 [Marchantia polymorpha]
MYIHGSSATFEFRTWAFFHSSLAPTVETGVEQFLCTEFVVTLACWRLGLHHYRTVSAQILLSLVKYLRKVARYRRGVLALASQEIRGLQMASPFVTDHQDVQNSTP